MKSRPGRIFIPAGALLMAVCGRCPDFVKSTPSCAISMTASGIRRDFAAGLLLLLLFFGASAGAWFAFGRMLEPVAVQKKIGFLIRTLILVQCAVILSFSLSLGIAVACCFPLARLASWKFYGS
ncbi:MAG: hypothetical protein V8T87_01705 [Victivallales bacterium]